MNESSKIIDIEKSSLIKLKAELLKLKKQTEELKNREQKPSKVKINKINEKKCENNNSGAKIIEIEDSSELDRSKRILEAKAKYYERMSKSKINSTLVLFKDKAENEINQDTDDDDL